MQYLMPFILAMVVAMAWLPVMVRIAGKFGIVDQPGARKVHLLPIPRVGGLAMAIGVLVASVIAIDLEVRDRWFLAAAGVLVAFGALDDRFDLDYRIKFVGQVAAVGIVVMLGDVRVQWITLDDRIMLPAWISLPLTIVFLVGITNAVNLADGLDGLAGGTTFLCLCAVAVFSSIGDQHAATALCLAFAGAVLGFLRFNTYPASVFMGDAGSQLLGFTIGVLSIRATQGVTTQVSAAIPILLLAIPIFDTASVMVQRISEGRSPFSPDRNHIHHKLLAFGFGHHEAVMVIYTLQANLFLAAYFLRYESDLTILAFVTAFFILSLTVMQLGTRFGWHFRAHQAAAPASGIDQLVSVLQLPALLPRLSHAAIVAALAAYAILVVVETEAMNPDVRILAVVLLAAAAGMFAVTRSGPLRVAEKAVLYITASVLVYLDAQSPAVDRFAMLFGWGSIAVIALATAVRLRLQNDRRFQLTPLDVIVLFMALVVPSLPGIFTLPSGSASTIAKLLIVFYSLEMLVGRAEGGDTRVRLGMIAILGSLLLRTLSAL